jgi:HlyD family secretion protein
VARRLFIAVVAAALLGAGGYLYYRSAYAPEAAPVYRTAKAERGTLTAAVTASGTLNAVVTVQVGSQISGQVREIHADFNSEVRKGQLIARIDPESYELKVTQAQADVEAARTQLLNQQSNVLVLQSQAARAKIQAEDARFDLERKSALAQKNFISGAERDKARFAHEAAEEQVRTAQAQIAAAQAQAANAAAVVKQRESQLAQAQVDLDRTFIRAPVDGTVILRNVDAGQTVAASLQAPVLFTIAQDLRKMQVDVAIDEADVGRIRIGHEVTFGVDAHPGRSFRGQVAQIRKAAQVLQNVVTYTVVVGADNQDLTLLPGMTANVRIVTATREAVLKVPNAALRFRPKGMEGTAATGKAAEAAAEAEDTLESRSERLVADLRLDEAQHKRLKAIFDDSRRRVAQLREAATSSLERRQGMARARQEVRNRISEMLNPEQQAQFRALLVEEATGRGGATAGRVFVAGAGGAARAVEVTLGLSDGSATEVTGGAIDEGTAVIVGVEAPAGTAARKRAAPNVKF